MSKKGCQPLEQLEQNSFSHFGQWTALALCTGCLFKLVDNFVDKYSRNNFGDNFWEQLGDNFKNIFIYNFKVNSGTIFVSISTFEDNIRDNFGDNSRTNSEQFHGKFRKKKSYLDANH